MTKSKLLNPLELDRVRSAAHTHSFTTEVEILEGDQDFAAILLTRHSGGRENVITISHETMKALRES